MVPKRGRVTLQCLFNGRTEGQVYWGTRQKQIPANPLVPALIIIHSVEWTEAGITCIPIHLLWVNMGLPLFKLPETLVKCSNLFCLILSLGAALFIRQDFTCQWEYSLITCTSACSLGACIPKKTEKISSPCSQSRATISYSTRTAENSLSCTWEGWGGSLNWKQTAENVA